MIGRVTLLLLLILAALIAATVALAALQHDLQADAASEQEPVGFEALAQPLEEPSAETASGYELEPDVPAAPADEAGPGLTPETAANEKADTAKIPTTAPAPIEEAREVFDQILDYEQWIVWGQRALLIAIVIVATLIALRVGRRLLLNVQESRHLPDSVMLPIRRTLRGLVLLFALILSLQFAGFSMTAIWATLGSVLALIAVGFIAVWSVLSNIACSLMLMMFKPFRIGDQVELVENAAGPNVGGRVIDVTLMYVVLREETDEGPAFIQIPNNLFFQKTVRRRAGKRAVPLEQHVEKHGLTGREQKPPGQA